MAGKLSFSIAINLLTENFKRGTSNVKNGLRSMQMQVLTFAAALGAGGIGLTDFVTRLIDVARETSRVTTALKNVSGGMGQFADNQRFLLDMAKKYGLEINALTGNFAKFTAASQMSGMSMENQRKIFESVSRACTAFGMSADDSNGVFLALSQMMSKGKISSEELRLQMGERLPIALQAMAKAAGVSVGELDKLMKQGKLMSKDVLPGFADALNKMIPNVDTDNLETSINRLKNAFTEFTNRTGIQSAYKGIIDWLTGAVQSAGENIKGIVNSVVAFIIGASLGRLFKWIVVELAKSQRAAMIAASRAAKAANVAFDKVVWKAKSAGVTISTMFARVGSSMKAAFVSALPTAILIFLSSVAAKLISMRQEAKRIRSLFSDYKAESNRVGQTEEIISLNTQLKLMNQKGASQEQIIGAQAKLQKMLGDENASQSELNKLVAKRVELLKAGAEVDFYTRKKLDTEEQISSLQRKKGRFAASALPTGGANNVWNGPMGIKTLWNVFNPFDGAITETNNIDSELAELNRILSDANSKLEDATAGANSLGAGDGNLGGGESDKKSALQKAEEKYAQSIRELNAKAGIEKLSKNEYNKALDELNASMYIDAKGSGDKTILESKYLQNLQKAVANPLYSKGIGELEELQKKYAEEESKLTNQLKNKQLTEKEYQEELRKLLTETSKAAGAISGVELESQAFIAAMQFNAKWLTKKPDMPKMESRDKTFDYEKSDADIVGEELDVAKRNLDKLKDAAKGNVETFTAELDTAIQNVTSLEEALKLAEVREDIKIFSNELERMSWGGFKGAVSNIDGVVSAFQRLQDAFDPESEASGWERLMAVWSAMTNVLDSFISICKMVGTLTELTDKLGKAKIKEGFIDTTVTETKVANVGKGAGADIAAASVKKITAKENVSASAAEGAAEAGKGAAKLPFPWNIVAIGGAIAAAMAAFALIPKFATGGVVGGNSYNGDKILARLNSGELVLNKGQQSRLSDAIDSQRAGYGGGGVVVSGTSKVKGDDIYLSLSNHVKRTGKKSPWK